LIVAVSKEPNQRNAGSEKKLKDRLAAIAKERAGLQQVFAREFPDFAALSNPMPMTAKDIQAQLSADEALVVMTTAEDNEGYVFAFTRDNTTWHPIPLGGQALAQTVAQFRNGLDLERLNAALDANSKPELFDLGFAYELYTTLFGPVEELVKGKKHVLIVPTGALTALPFSVLVTERPAIPKPDHFTDYRDVAWLIKRQSITVLPSIASLKALRAFDGKMRSTKPMIGFGDPVFNPDSAAGPIRTAAASSVRSVATRSYVDFWRGAGVDRNALTQSLSQLPDTADELKNVAQRLGVPDGDIFLGPNATEAAVKSARLADYRIIYFATHGLVAGDVKGLAEPSLALSIPKSPTDLDDGLLTASEVAQLKLNADWVVLSACNTIAGDKPGAEALSGLARAFFYAGARSLLVSHWAVDSAAATRLAVTVFAKLDADPGLGRSEALRLAMLEHLHDADDPKNAYPGYWAPLVVVGDGR
jgi:CHAT domain-containing protein